MSYQLLDSGDQRKLEAYGDIVIARPCSQAIWHPQNKKLWQGAASFSREQGTRWEGKIPSEWVVKCEGLKFKLSPTDFGHLGIFPEHKMHWAFVKEALKGKKAKVLNLFAYSGGVTLAAALAGAEVTHVDASKGMVSWARDNAALNQCEDRPIRWIVDDVSKFCTRELKRGRSYDAVILDPPTFGRGAKGEVFKIEEHLPPLLDLIVKLLSPKPLFVLLTCHTPAFSQSVLSHLLKERLKGAQVTAGETLLESQSGFALPCGHFARGLYE